MNVDGIDDIGHLEYAKRMPAHLKRIQEGKRKYLHAMPPIRK